MTQAFSGMIGSFGVVVKKKIGDILVTNSKLEKNKLIHECIDFYEKISKSKG